MSELLLKQGTRRLICRRFAPNTWFKLFKSINLSSTDNWDMRTSLDSTSNDESESESSTSRVDFAFCFFDRALSFLSRSLFWKSDIG